MRNHLENIAEKVKALMLKPPVLHNWQTLCTVLDFMRTALTVNACIRGSVDALCRDGAGLISRERVKRGRLTRQGTTS